MVLSSSWLLSLIKVTLMSAGVLTFALFCKVSVPMIMDFSASKTPVLWSSFLSWLKPPYLYIIINCIIVGIVASSRFFKFDDVPTESPSTPSDRTVYDEIRMQSEYGGVNYEQRLQRVEEESEPPLFMEKRLWLVVLIRWRLIIEMLRGQQKPLVSARFGHRKPIKASPEGGRALRVTKPKRNETLENTWKAITDGRAMPLTRHLKKSDRWENHGHQVNVEPSPVKKLETFKDRTNYQSPPLSKSPGNGGKIRKEPSLSQDELNRRVEAFIKKFNEEMRLQRQESLKQYQEMISRGV
ncbi:uncharacterized protein LOC123218901 [Mangifera indica]|uniref:uncharacterized protein LOC123218901 n=1 Tax=Mangifera indica TaxID=29780 RepID=UPI001CF9305D|nr:uncharacterized protein LOC123218901 [Mangifera indica]